MQALTVFVDYNMPARISEAQPGPKLQEIHCVCQQPETKDRYENSVNSWQFLMDINVKRLCA